MDVDNSIYPGTLMQPCDDMDVDMGKACPTRTKPVNTNKYAKKAGANNAKKLEISEIAAAPDVLTSAAATMYRPLSAKCKHLSQARPDIS